MWPGWGMCCCCLLTELCRLGGLGRPWMKAGAGIPGRGDCMVGELREREPWKWDWLGGNLSIASIVQALPWVVSGLYCTFTVDNERRCNNDSVRLFIRYRYRRGSLGWPLGSDWIGRSLWCALSWRVQFITFPRIVLRMPACILAAK